jgi:4-amino-4-deoxy-L-arabinose transferase-like glycosyltransferase
VNGNESRARGIALAVIVLLGVAIRLGWGIHQSNLAGAMDALPDQREYLEAGRNLVESGELWISDPRFRQSVYAYRTPGYPGLIAACGAKPAVVRAVQALLDGCSMVAIFIIARRWLAAPAALAAVLLVAINPYLIFFSGLILSETLFTALLCWGLALLIISEGPWTNRRGSMAWVGGAFLLALAVLVRPGAILLPVVLGCGAAIANRGVLAAYPSHRRLPVAGTLLAITFLVLFPWAVRNRWVLGTWVWTSTNDGITRYDGFNPDATGASDQSFVRAMPWTIDMTEVGRSAYFASLADEWILAHPLESIRLAGVKIARTWSPVPLSAEYGRRTIYRVVGLTFGAGFDLLFIAGLMRKELTGSAKLVLSLPAIYLTVAAVLSVGSLRYRIPAEAPMAVVAGCGLLSFRPPPAGATPES